MNWTLSSSSRHYVSPFRTFVSQCSINISRVQLFLFHVWLFYNPTDLPKKIVSWKRILNENAKHVCRLYLATYVTQPKILNKHISSSFSDLKAEESNNGHCPRQSLSPITIIKVLNLRCRLDHKNVVKLLEAYESRTCVYLVMELWVCLKF